MLLGHAPHIDHQIGAQIAWQVRSITVDMANARVAGALAAMKDGDVVTGVGKRSYDMRADEARPADDQNVHLRGEHAELLRDIGDRRDGPIEVLARVGRADLAAQPRLSLRHHGETEA